MKKFYIFGMAMIIALAFASCGSEKKMANNQPQKPSYQQNVRDQFSKDDQKTDQAIKNDIKQPTNNPTNKNNNYSEVQLNHCIMKSIDDTAPNLRALGVYVSYDQSNAIKQATAEARTELANSIRVSVEGANKSYAKEVGVNQDVASKRLAQSTYTQYVAEQVANSPRIDMFIEQADGKYQVYVCVEMKVSKKELTQTFAKTISDDEVLRAEYEAQKFEKEIDEGLDEYKRTKNQAIVDEYK